jgi:hypothetical protein
VIFTALTSGEMTAADIAAVVGNRNGDGFGWGGEGGLLTILLILALFGGGFGFGGGWGGGFGGFGGMYEFPWILTGQQGINNNTNSGFRDSMLQDGITSVRDGIAGLSTQLCGCCSDMQMALANGFAGVEQGANARQMANMQTAFATQNAINQGFNATQSQLAQCCCDQRLATADLKYTIATEECATRNAAAMNTRDIIESGNRNSQAILDKLCQLELDGLKQDNANLRTQLNMANLAASQNAQTAELRQSGATQLNQLVSELRSCPIPSQPVYGSQPIFTCGSQNVGCGCGCAG